MLTDEIVASHVDGVTAAASVRHLLEARGLARTWDSAGEAGINWVGTIRFYHPLTRNGYYPFSSEISCREDRLNSNQAFLKNQVQADSLSIGCN